MNYRDSVMAAATALKHGEDANWELAKLTFENTALAGQGRRVDGAQVSVGQWSRDVMQASGRDFTDHTARVYRSVWEQHGNRPGAVSWSEAYADTRGGSVGERMVEADFNRSMKNATPEFKSEAFQRLAEDPDVVTAAISKPETRQAIYAGLAQAHTPEQPDAPTFGEFKEQILQKVAGPNGRDILLDGLQQVEKLTRTFDVAWLTRDLSMDEAAMIERDIPRYIAWLNQVRDAARRCARRMELVQ